MIDRNDINTPFTINTNNTTSTVTGFDDDFTNPYNIWISVDDSQVKLDKLLKQEAIEEMKSGYNNPIVMGKPLKSKVNNKDKVSRSNLIKKIRSD